MKRPRLAVIDVETTGLNPYNCDRVVEIAAPIVRPDGEVLREFVSLVNPERDIGPTSIHGLTSADVLPAPRFGELAGALREFLSECVAVAGHNVRFDLSFLSCEYKRLGYTFPSCPRICTMRLAGGGTLSACCAEYDIPMSSTLHSALNDARATSQLLGKLLKYFPKACEQIDCQALIPWPKVPVTSVNPLTRDETRRRQSEPPTYIQKLRNRATSSTYTQMSDEAALAYLGVLDHVLEDRSVTETEGQNLLALADQWGLTNEFIGQLHLDYLARLADAAFANGLLTDAERRDLTLVSHLLGINQDSYNRVLQNAKAASAGKLSRSNQLPKVQSQSELRGKRVCFTGECQCRLHGAEITREKAMEIASEHGLVVVDSVTRTLDLLVIADTQSQSGKAKKARQYGIRLIHEPVFWKAIGLSVE